MTLGGDNKDLYYNKSKGDPEKTNKDWLQVRPWSHWLVLIAQTSPTCASHKPNGPGALFKARGEALLVPVLRMIVLCELWSYAAGSFSPVMPLAVYPRQTWDLHGSPASCWTWLNILPCLRWWILPTAWPCTLWLSSAPSSSFMNQPGSCCSRYLGSCVSSLEICYCILILFLGSSEAVYTCVLLVSMLAETSVWCRLLSNCLVK